MTTSPLLRVSIVGGRCFSLFLLAGCLCFFASSVSAQQESGAAARASSVVRGRAVYEDTGKPMRFARVFLTVEKNRVRPLITSTDARGEFSFHNVAAGNYLASVLPPDAYGAHNYPAPPEGGEPVSTDGVSKVELKLRGARGGAITGKITYADGEPVVAARLILLRGVGEGWQNVGQCCTGGPLTDDRGVYRLYGLPPGEYKVGVAEEGLQVESDANGGISSSSAQALVTVYYPSVVGSDTATSIKVTQGRTAEGVDIAMPDVRTHSVSGTVSLGGQPLRGAPLMLHWANSQSYAPGYKMSFADAEGKWTFKSVPDGNFIIFVQPGGGLRDSDPEKVARMRKVIGESRKVTVAGADVEGLAIALSEGGVITGTVSVEGGGALPQHISLATNPAEEAPQQSPSGPARGEVERSGAFRVEGVKPGEIFLDPESVYPTGYYYIKSVTWNGQDIIRTPLRVAEGGEIKGVRITLATGLATLTGRTQAAEAGQPPQQPAARCGVWLVPADAALWGRRWSHLWAEVNAEGKFNLKGAPGEYLVWLNPQFNKGVTQFIKDQAPSAQRVTLRAREETKLELSQRCEK